MTLALALAMMQLPPIGPFAADLRSAITSGNESKVKNLFLSPDDSDFLLRMAAGRGGMRKMKLSVIPAPPGWEASGKYWAVVHTRQDIQDYRDTVFPIVVSNERFKLGPEIPEDASSGIRVTHAKLNVSIHPQQSRVDVQSSLTLATQRLSRAPLFRLNGNFTISRAVLTEGEARTIKVGDDIPTPREGDLVHAGGLLIPWTKSNLSQAVFDYSGTLTSTSEDKVDTKACYLTAWWVPTLGRAPFTTSTRVEGPADWILQSEGRRISREESGATNWQMPTAGRQEQFFRCDIPISFPKVVGGKYQLAAEQKTGSKIYRAYHFEPIDKDRAERDIQTMVDAIAWYEKNLAPFPFEEYSCYDADTYYGIESYNYTLLNSRITRWAIAHEIGHTFFGGLVPAAYVHDSWNESMTQYVDSVLRQNNADRTLESAAATLNVKVPLSEMSVAHEYNSATYSRGAYVLRMLEHEIGTPAMYQAMKGLISDRLGKETTWSDLRQYFELAGKKKLDWFWRQWISGATFPTLTVTDAQGIPHPKGTKVFVTVRQSGTASPFRLRFKVYAASNNRAKVEKVVEMTSPEATFELDLGPNKAYEAGVDLFGYVLAPQVKPRVVKF